MNRMMVSGLTDIGSVRTNNEDTFLIDNSLLIVADGMGGAAAGEVASKLAVNTISGELKNFSYTNDEEVTQLLKKSIKKADGDIKAQMSKDSSLSGMGTTVVMALHMDSRLLIGNVGDSRAYIITNKKAGLPKEPEGNLKSSTSAETGVMKAIGSDIGYGSGESITRITQDHSVVMEMVNSGVILEEDIRTHPMRNRITRCLGSIGDSEPDFFWYDISDGDTLILCSDGLWEMVHEDLMMAIVNSSKKPEDICKRLILAANNSGGVDNITVITAMFEKV